MQRIILMLFVSTFLCLTSSCQKDNDNASPSPETSLTERLTAGKWTYELLETKLFVNDVLTEEQADIGGCLEFDANNTGKLTYSNADFDPTTWSINANGTRVTMSIDSNTPIDFEILVNETNRQEWEGTASDGQGAVVEVTVKMTR